MQASNQGDAKAKKGMLIETSIQPRQEEAKAKECVLKVQACRQAAISDARAKKDAEGTSIQPRQEGMLMRQVCSQGK